MGRVCHVTSAQNTGNNCGIASERVNESERESKKKGGKKEKERKRQREEREREKRWRRGEKIRSRRGAEEEGTEAMWRTVVARREIHGDRKIEKGKREDEGREREEERKSDLTPESSTPEGEASGSCCRWPVLGARG